MANPTHITVTAPTGRRTPVHPSDGAEPGGAVLFVEPGAVRRVAYSQTIRRSITRGDLTPCTMDGAACGVELAAAPNDLTDDKAMPAGKTGKAQ